MTKPLVLFHVSDIHFGLEDRHALDRFAADVADERPAAVLCTGDLTMRARHREYAAAAEYLSALPAPVMVELGNHDMPYFNPFERMFDPLRRYRKLEAAVAGKLDLPGIGLTSLKTSAAAQWRLNWSKGSIAQADLDAALRRLASQSGQGLRLVTCHHPLIEADTEATASTRGGREALAALAQAGADVVLSGHVHDAFDLQVEAGGRMIRMIGAGTLSRRLRATAPSYNRLEWSPAAGLSVRAIPLG